MEVMVSSSHIVSATPSSSHSCPAPPWGPSHGRQFPTNFSNVSPSHGLQLFMNYPSVGPSHEVQSFRNKLLQCGSPKGSQALPANLLQHWLLSPLVYRSCQEPAPARPPHRVTASFGHPPALAWGPPLAADGYLLHCGPPWAAGAQPALPGSAPWAAGESLLQQLEHLLPFFCTDLGVCRVISFTYSRSSLWLLFCSSFFPFLTMLSQRRYHHR